MAERDEAAPVITIDGPSGSGKGTVARMVARSLGFRFLDSGALYRVVALASLNRGLAAEQAQALATLARSINVKFLSRRDGDVQVMLDNVDVTFDLRLEKVGDRASRIAAHPELREALLERQRRWSYPPGLVADGRDMGTVVFPDACLKIFLTASAEIRAQRRYKQLIEKGIEANIDTLLADIIDRDRRDLSRETAPLKAAPDAVEIDSSSLAVDQVVVKVLDFARQRLSAIS
jgi:cytidylate kinase